MLTLVSLVSYLLGDKNIWQLDNFLEIITLILCLVPSWSGTLCRDDGLVAHSMPGCQYHQQNSDWKVKNTNGSTPEKSWKIEFII